LLQAQASSLLGLPFADGPDEAHALPVPKSVMPRKESSLIPTLRSEKALPAFCPDEY